MKQWFQWLNVHLLDHWIAHQAVSLRMKIFQPVTSYSSCLISTSQSCFKSSIMPPGLNYNASRSYWKNRSLIFWDIWDVQDVLCSCYRSQHPTSSKNCEKALYWTFLSFFVSLEMYFNLQLLEAFSHFLFLFWVYLPWKIFLEQMVDCHSKKMHVASLVHETHVLGATMTGFLWVWEHPST